jgi:hypothetical protein
MKISLTNGIVAILETSVLEMPIPWNVSDPAAGEVICLLCYVF